MSEHRMKARMNLRVLMKDILRMEDLDTQELDYPSLERSSASVWAVPWVS